MYVALGSPPIKTYVANDRIDVVHYTFNHDRCVSALGFLKELRGRSLSVVFLYGPEQGCSMKGLKSGGGSLSALPRANTSGGLIVLELRMPPDWLIGTGSRQRKLGDALENARTLASAPTYAFSYIKKCQRN